MHIYILLYIHIITLLAHIVSILRHHDPIPVGILDTIIL